MPPVIVAVASTVAYVGAASLVESAILGAILGGIAAFGTTAIGNAVFGLNEPQDLAGLEPAQTWLTNEPSNTAALPVVYGQRRMGGTIVFAQVTGHHNEYLHVVYAICEGPVEALGALYLNNEQVPVELSGLEDRAVLELSGTIFRRITVEFKVLEPAGAVSGTVSDDWDDVVAWASETYAGHLVLGRDYLDGLDDSNNGPYTFGVDMDVPNVEAGNTVSLAVEYVQGGPFGVDFLQRPTAENDYTARIAMERYGTGDAWPFSIRIRATYYTAGGSQYSGLVEYHPHLGEDNQVADALLAERCEGWTAQHRLRGVAYAYLRFKYSADGFPGGVPQATFDVTGRKVYDPRSEATAWSDNPALCIRDYLTNGLYGRGLPAAQVDDAAISEAADYYDELQDDGYGGTVRRYRCNGVVDTSQTALNNMQALLRSCRSWLTHVAGVYQLVPDRPRAATFELSESKITGGWQISPGDSKTLTNRVTAKFYNPDLDWLEDYQIADSPELRALDAGVLLERDLALEFIVDPSTAKRLATLEVNASRQAMVVQVDVQPKGLDILPCDVGTIRHPIPGWSDGKLFRVLNMRLKESGDIQITLQEYAEAVYTAPEILLDDPAPDSNLPAPTTCAAPTAPAAAEYLYETRAGRGVGVGVLVTWTAPADPYVRSYELQHMVHEGAEGDDSWELAETTPATSARVLDLAPGRHGFRVRAVNSLGVRSDWSPATHQDVVGLAAAPATITGLAASPIGGALVLSWDEHQDLDVKLGGYIRIRHNSNGTAWDCAQDVVTVAGAATTAAVPLLAGTYLVRAVDSTGNLAAAATTVTVEDADHLGLVVAGTWNAATAWTGTHTGTEVSSGQLRLQTGYLAGEWVSGTSLQVGSTPSVYRLRAILTALVADLTTTFDDRGGLMDSWPDFDGTDDAVTSVEVWVQGWTGSAWGQWQRLTAADSNNYLWRFKVVLRRAVEDYNVNVSALTVDAMEVS